MSRTGNFFGCALALGGVTAVSASGALIQPGIYQLHDHPDANQDPPPYGVRWDGLDGSGDVFTISLDTFDADVKMTFDGSEIRIFGTGYGGRDAGGAYANDEWLGYYEIDFTFDVGVGLAPGDDDILVDAPSASNFGTIEAPNGVIKNIEDKRRNSEGGTFRLGDEDNDNGHRGFPGISGWGWIEITGEQNGNRTRDFLFTAEYLGIPSPGTLALAPLALIATRRRRA